MCTAAASPHYTLAPLVCLSHTRVQVSSKEEDDANTSTSCRGSHLPNDPVLGSRLRADGHADDAPASRIGGPVLRHKYYSLGEGRRGSCSASDELHSSALFD